MLIGYCQAFKELAFSIVQPKRVKMNYKTTESSQVTMVELMLPSHSNFSGKIHGGHILNLMDQVAFACASKHSSQYCVTASVNRVDFLHPIQVGELVSLKASINYTGRTSMVVGFKGRVRKHQDRRSQALQLLLLHYGG